MQKTFLSTSAILVILWIGFASFARPEPQENVVIKDLVRLEGAENGASVEVEVPDELKDLSAFMGLSARIANTGKSLCRVEGFLNDRRWINSCIYLEAGEIKTIEILFKRLPNRGIEDLPAMNGLPGGALWHWESVEPSKTEKVTFVVSTEDECSVSISEIRPYGEFTPPEELVKSKGFFPFIDRFGQYKHDNWPGKLDDERGFTSAYQKEQKELSLIPEPERRNRYGGWLDGPKLKATGHFRTEKVEGKWWLVDPEGRLFWSHGVTCVGFGGANTRISGREKFFEELPAENEPLHEFFNRARNGTNFNFSQANLYRKYGSEWKKKSTVNILKRLKSWGINSFGNWSDPEVYLFPENRVPYTVAISPRWPRIDSENAKFPDVFDPGFQRSVAEAMRNNGIRMKDDPYCIGYFVDNELSVGGLTEKITKQPAEGFGKQAFIGYLKEKYSTINSLNQHWQTNYSGWRDLGNLTELPLAARGDSRDFDRQILDLYHKTCLGEVKKVAPDKLYLGSRLHCHYYPDDQSEIEVIRIAARYCDVVTFNRYRFSANDLILPDGIEKPTMIGEFHFGALDRGQFHTGLRSVASQQQRAEAYYQFVKGALDNPQIVGTHWFQYSDQAFTGRGDGENYQIGFIDICDNPYPEIVNAARKIGYQLYELRSQ